MQAFLPLFFSVSPPPAPPPFLSGQRFAGFIKKKKIATELVEFLYKNQCFAEVRGEKNFKKPTFVILALLCFGGNCRKLQVTCPRVRTASFTIQIKKYHMLVPNIFLSYMVSCARHQPLTASFFLENLFSLNILQVPPALLYWSDSIYPF